MVEECVTVTEDKVYFKASKSVNVETVLTFKREDINNNIIEGLIKKIEELSIKLENLSKSYYERKISDEEAKIEIINFIKQLKSSGKTKMNFVDLICELKLPSEQIEKIMDELEGKSI
jgi:hypothetical protein